MSYIPPAKTEVLVTIRRHHIENIDGQVGTYLELLHSGRTCGITAKTTGEEIATLLEVAIWEVVRYKGEVAADEALPDSAEYKAARLHHNGHRLRRAQALVALLEAYQELAAPVVLWNREPADAKV